MTDFGLEMLVSSSGMTAFVWVLCRAPGDGFCVSSVSSTGVTEWGGRMQAPDDGICVDPVSGTGMTAFFRHTLLFTLHCLLVLKMCLYYFKSGGIR